MWLVYVYMRSMGVCAWLGCVLYVVRSCWSMGAMGGLAYRRRGQVLCACMLQLGCWLPSPLSLHGTSLFLSCLPFLRLSSWSSLLRLHLPVSCIGLLFAYCGGRFLCRSHRVLPSVALRQLRCSSFVLPSVASRQLRCSRFARDSNWVVPARCGVRSWTNLRYLSKLTPTALLGGGLGGYR